VSQASGWSHLVLCTSLAAGIRSVFCLIAVLLIPVLHIPLSWIILVIFSCSPCCNILSQSILIPHSWVLSYPKPSALLTLRICPDTPLYSANPVVHLLSSSSVLLSQPELLSRQNSRPNFAHTFVPCHRPMAHPVEMIFPQDSRRYFVNLHLTPVLKKKRCIPSYNSHNAQYHQ
jgi:hypothetical protein